MAPFRLKCYLQPVQCCSNKWMSKLEMTCFSGASRVTLAANFPHPVPCFCLVFVPATQLQRSVQPAWLSLMWLQLSCHGNSVSPMRQGFRAGKHFRLDAPRLASARWMGDAADKAGGSATHWSVGLDTLLPPGWHHRLRCRPRCPVPWCLLAQPVSKSKFAVLKTSLFSCPTAVKSKETTCAKMKQLHCWQNVKENAFPAANANCGLHPHFRLIETPLTPTPTPSTKETIARHAKTVRRSREQERLTWKDDVGWMLTLACLQWSPWLPIRDHTGPSELVWPFCLRKAFSVPA